jgi:hypothetical protein
MRQVSEGSSLFQMLDCQLAINHVGVLKNSFQGVSTAKLVCKLLNVRSPQAMKFTEITALVPFSTATHDGTHNSKILSGRLVGKP